MKWIIIYCKGTRIASFEYTRENLEEIKRQMMIIPFFVDFLGNLSVEAFPKTYTGKCS